MSREDPQMKLRLTEELRDRLKIEAERNKRSMNAEIVARLERSVEMDRQWEDQQRRVEASRPRLNAEWAAYQESAHPLDVAAREASQAMENAIRAKVWTDLADAGMLDSAKLADLERERPDIYRVVRAYIDGKK